MSYMKAQIDFDNQEPGDDYPEIEAIIDHIVVKVHTMDGRDTGIIYDEVCNNSPEEIIAIFHTIERDNLYHG